MQDRLINIAIGLVAGVCGALVVGARSSSSNPVGPATAATEVARDGRSERMPGLVVPPGWDVRYLDRVNELAARVDAIEARTEPAAPLTEREQGRSEHYRRELETQEARVAEHQREELDAPWATTSAERVRATADALGRSLRTIDCRSKTCITSLRFSTPTAGLEFLRSREVSQLGRGFSGLTSTPTPPTATGDYDLMIVFDR
jgi:hypothetical protein